MDTATAPSPIAVKGFVLGYMHKEAADDPTKKGPAPQEFSTMEHGLESGAEPGSFTGQRQIHAGAVPPEDVSAASKDNYSQLYSLLKGVAPGAAVGAAAAGGGSALSDKLRGKPVHVKRALILALTLGVPLGTVTQLLHGSATGKGFGLRSAGNILGQAGGQTVGAAQGGLANILSGAKEQGSAFVKGIKGDVGAGEGT